MFVSAWKVQLDVLSFMSRLKGVTTLEPAVSGLSWGDVSQMMGWVSPCTAVMWEQESVYFILKILPLTTFLNAN